MKKTNYFDLHCDTPYECFIKNQDFYKNSLAVSGEKGENFEKWYQTFAIWIKDDTPSPFSLYKEILTDFKKKLKAAPENLTPLFAVEGGAVCENDSDSIFILQNDGIKLLTLTWNGENSIAGGVNTKKGLTAFGKEVITKMNKVKIGCDLSHLNEKSFWGAIEETDFPIATHSNPKAVFNCKRNLSDSQIKAIAEKDGIIGLCFYPEFLGGEVYEKLYEAVFYLLDMGLENNIAIGSDFDGAKMDKKLCDISKIPDLYGFFKAKGIEKQLLNKIFYGNAYNFIAKLN